MEGRKGGWVDGWDGMEWHGLDPQEWIMELRPLLVLFYYRINTITSEVFVLGIYFGPCNDNREVPTRYF